MTMDSETRLDGNALGGLLIELFGREMTDARGCCASCGARNPVGQLMVYRSGPGDVVRCPGCSAVLLVATPRPGGTRVYFGALSWLQPPG
jgi:hypothetical protein